MRYSEGFPVRLFFFRVKDLSRQIIQWSYLSVWISFMASIIFTVLFLLIEIYVAVEPVLPPYLISQRVPVLIGCSSALVAVCNLSVTYYFPTWFQTVMLTSASTAGKTIRWHFYGVFNNFVLITGLHLLPNSICISTGSFFAG
jgi:hypothetical protein